MSQPLSVLLAAGTGASPPDRAQRLLVAQRLAEVVASAHAAGGVIGNLDDQHVLVEPDGTVTLSDDAGRATWASAPAYTAPELQGAFTSHTRREAQHDLFALAVLLFQLLMDGRHPYAGQWVGGGDLPDIPKAIQLGLYAYGGSSVTPPPGAPALSTLEPGLADLFKRSFAPTSAIFRTRPTGAEWARALAATRQNGTSRLPPPAPAFPDPGDRSVANLEAPAAAPAVKPASPVAPDEATAPVLQGPAPVPAPPDPLIELATALTPADSVPEPTTAAAPEPAPQEVPEAPLEAPSVSRSEAGQPEAHGLPRPAKRSFSRRSMLQRVVPANDASSALPVPSRAAQPEPGPLENFVSEMQWLAESDLRGLFDPKVWGTIVAVIFGFLFVLSILAFVRPDDRANPLGQPARSLATQVPATQTPLPLPTATRTVVTNRTVASFGSNFDISDGVIPSTGEDFSAYVRERALRLEVFARGARGKVMFNAAPAVGDFNFTVRVGETTGQGELLIYIQELESHRTWVLAVDPAAETWGLSAESASSLTPVIAPLSYQHILAREPVRTITVARKGGRTSVMINGTIVSYAVAGTMPDFTEPVQVGIGAMIPDDPDYADGPFILTVERVAMLADEG